MANGGTVIPLAARTREVVSGRLLRTVGSTLLLIGAFVIGWTVHHVFFVGDLSVTSPTTLLGIAGGLASVIVGRHLEGKFDPVEYVGGLGSDDEGDRSEPISPLDDADPRDADPGDADPRDADPRDADTPDADPGDADPKDADPDE